MKRLAVLTMGAFALCAPLSAHAASAGAEPSYREIKDWILACDNAASCEAKFVLEDEGDSKTLPAGATQGYLSIVRDAGPAGHLLVMTQSMEDGAPGFDPSAMSIDGKALTAVWAKNADDNAILEGEAARRLIAAAADGKLLTFVNGGKPQTVSLSGLKAVLLAMDVAQGRVGTETALAKPGSGPASGVPAAPALPVIHAAPVKGEVPNAAAFTDKVRVAEAAVLTKHECATGVSTEDEAHPLNGAEALVLLHCQMFAYQSSVLAFRVPLAAPDKAQLLILPDPPTLKRDPSDARGEYVEGGWDADTATFSEAAKGRGLADCGISTDWIFDGKAFHLSHFSRQERCGGPPGDWPTLYQAEVKTTG